MTFAPRIAFATALILMFWTLPAFAGPTVLLLWDVKGPQTASLEQALTRAGLKVVYSDTNESGWDGTNPGLKEIDVVVHLNGMTWMTEMPRAGQKALVNFVKAGGGYIHHEWNAYQLGVGQMLDMRDLILFDRTSGYSGEIVIKRHTTEGLHPVTWEVPETFKMQGSCNIGKVHQFKENPAMVLARDQNDNDAIAAREIGLGRIVGFHHGGNWQGGPGLILDSQDARQLYVDAVTWAYGCTPYFRKGLREGVCKQIEARRGALP